MPKLYLITGPAGVGKSTVSKRLAESLEKSVLLEGDDFYHQVISSYTPAWKENNHLEVFYKVVINTIKIYLDNGYDVVFNYIISNDKYKEFKSIFKDLKFTVLLVNEETLIKRDKLREEKNRMNERCLILLNNFKNGEFNQNNILYTDNLTVEETVLEIINNNRFTSTEEL